MDTLRGIDSFVKAVEGGSIAAAARQLGITAAAASQNIARLEQELGTRLLVRSTRRLSLTESGSLYYERVRGVVRELQLAQAAVTELHGEPQGRLRVACSVAFARHVLAPLVPAFTERFPRVSLELVVADRSVDHVKEDIDVSIRFGEQLEPGLVARRIATIPVVYCASPAYLARAGTPQQPEELAQHACLLFRLPIDGRLLRWWFVRGGTRFEPMLNPTIVTNDVDTLAQLAVAGAGITRLGVFIANPLIERGLLVPLFLPCSLSSKGAAQVDGAPLDFHACYRDRKDLTHKVRAFVDYVAGAMHDHPALRMPQQHAQRPQPGPAKRGRSSAAAARQSSGSRSRL